MTKRAGLTRSTGGRGASEAPLTNDLLKDFFKVSYPVTFTVEAAVLEIAGLGLGEL